MTDPNNQQAERQKETQHLRKEKETLKRELVLEAADAAGLAVPRQVAVIGVDNDWTVAS